jgi:hypothetical protein
VPVSLDGYIAGPRGSGFDHLFTWCTAGDVETPSHQPERLTYRTNTATAAYLRELLDSTGAVVVGRRLFDATNGWNGSHPLGTPVFVVTHQPPPDWTNTDTRSPSSPTASRQPSPRRMARASTTAADLACWAGGHGRAAHHLPPAGGAIPPRGRGSDEDSDE